MSSIRIAVTGAAGQIGYSLLPRIAAGEMFGLDKKISFDEAIKLSKRDTRRYVKRQITWFSHNYIPYKTIHLK